MDAEIYDVGFQTDRVLAPPPDFIRAVYDPIVYRLLTAMQYCPECYFGGEFKCTTIGKDKGVTLFDGKIKGKPEDSDDYADVEIACISANESKEFRAVRVMKDLRTKTYKLRFSITFDVAPDGNRDSLISKIRYSIHCALDDFACNAGYPVLSQADEMF